MIHWNLLSFLQQEELSVYSLAQQLGGQTRQRVLYSITAQERGGLPSNTGLGLVSEIIEALSILLGRDIEMWDVLELR